MRQMYSLALFTRVYRARHVRQTHTLVRWEFVPELHINVVQQIFATQARHQVHLLICKQVQQCHRQWPSPL
jgi:hypothetical protein